MSVIFTLLLSYIVPVKSKVKILQNFVAFYEYMNFTGKVLAFQCDIMIIIMFIFLKMATKIWRYLSCDLNFINALLVFVSTYILWFTHIFFCHLPKNVTKYCTPTNNLYNNKTILSQTNLFQQSKIPKIIFLSVTQYDRTPGL